MEVHGFKLFNLIASLLFMSNSSTNPFNLDTWFFFFNIGYTDSTTIYFRLIHLTYWYIDLVADKRVQLSSAINGQKKTDLHISNHGFGLLLSLFNLSLSLTLSLALCEPLGSCLCVHYNVPWVPTVSGAHNEDRGYISDNICTKGNTALI